MLVQVFSTLDDSAARQFTRKRGALFWVALQGIDADQLLSVHEQDSGPGNQPTALKLGVSNFLQTGGRRDRNAIVAPFASLYPGIGISNHPYKANRPLRDDEFKGADIAKGSTPANIRQAFA